MTNKLVILKPMRYYLLYFAISLSVIIPGVYSLIRFGLVPSIDFTGGTNIVWQVNSNHNESAIRSAISALGANTLSYQLTSNQLKLTTTPLSADDYKNLLNNQDVINTKVSEISYETVGPSLGGELIKKTIIGILLSATLIMFYVAYRFRSIRYGVSAILAMLHDSLVLVGTFSLLGHYLGVEVDTLFVTAVLTILSFSVHDTIVVYDRIRELKKHYHYLDFEEIVNRAVVETMGRSLNNSLTIIYMLLAMYLLGGDSIHWFIFALLIGTISGTYSSTFTAAPLLVAWERIQNKKSAK